MPAFVFDTQELTNVFDILKEEIGNNISTEALKKGAEVILREQIKEVPKLTHALEESLDISKPIGRGANRKIRVGIQNAKHDEVVYGYYQEYGTKRMAGKRWMETAFYNGIGEANGVMVETIQKGLKK